MVRLSKAAYWVYRKACYVPGFAIALPFIVLGLLYDRIHGTLGEPSILISRIPFHIGSSARWFYYKALLSSVGSDVRFGYGSYCNYRKARIGNRVSINHFCEINQVAIGDSVMIAGYVRIMSGLHHHSFDEPDRLIWDTPTKEGRRMITIGSDVWIGGCSIIGCDVGNRCVIGAGSVVVKEIEPHSLAAGNPARLIRRI